MKKLASSAHKDSSAIRAYKQYSDEDMKHFIADTPEKLVKQMDLSYLQRNNDCTDIFMHNKYNLQQK